MFWNPHGGCKEQITLRVFMLKISHEPSAKCVYMLFFPVQLMLVETEHFKPKSSSLKFFTFRIAIVIKILLVILWRSSLHYIMSYLQGELCLALDLPSSVNLEAHFSGNYFLVYVPPRVCLLSGCQLCISYMMICHIGPDQYLWKSSW